MTFRASESDIAFRAEVESFSFPVSAFSHRAHLRLAYVYLTQNSADQSVILMRDTLKKLLAHNGVDTAKYHETITRAWILAVHHFMNITGYAGSADELIDCNPVMLDTKIMLTHYSAERLFSDRARAAFIQPDLDPIPLYSA